MIYALGTVNPRSQRNTIQCRIIRVIGSLANRSISSSNRCFFGIFHDISWSLAHLSLSICAFARLCPQIWWHSINANLRESNERSAITNTELTWRHFTRDFTRRTTSQDNRRRSVPFTGRPSSAPGLRPLCSLDESLAPSRANQPSRSNNYVQLRSAATFSCSVTSALASSLGLYARAHL